MIERARKAWKDHHRIHHSVHRLFSGLVSTTH